MYGDSRYSRSMLAVYVAGAAAVVIIGGIVAVVKWLGIAIAR